MVITAIAAVLGTVALAAIVTAIGIRTIERAHPPRGQFVDIGDIRLHLAVLDRRDQRDGKRPAVVLIHGASGNLEDMRLALGDRLSHRHRVILVDRPGHGWSERPTTRAAALPSHQAALLGQALDRLEVKRAVLVGHSWAGALATAYALAAPGRVAGLVLVAPVSHPSPVRFAWYYHFASLPVIGDLFTKTFSLPYGAVVLKSVAAAVFAPQAAPQGYVRRASIALALRPKTFRANARDVVGLRAFLADQAPRYPEIQVPTIIITGDRDDIVRPRIHSHALAASLPHAKLRVLEGIGHMPHHSVPDVIVAAIDEIVAADAAQTTLS